MEYGTRLVRQIQIRFRAFPVLVLVLVPVLVPVVVYHSLVDDFVPGRRVPKQCIDVDPAKELLFSEPGFPEQALVFVPPERRGIKFGHDGFF